MTTLVMLVLSQYKVTFFPISFEIIYPDCSAFVCTHESLDFVNNCVRMFCFVIVFSLLVLLRMQILFESVSGNQGFSVKGWFKPGVNDAGAVAES